MSDDEKRRCILYMLEALVRVNRLVLRLNPTLPSL
jgi:hypothetical protein